MTAIRRALAFVILFASLALVVSSWSQLIAAVFLILMAINGFKLADAIVAHVRTLRRQPKHEPLNKIPDFPAQAKRPPR